ncbi:MAG: glycosyltransferase family 4 protein [Nibricoccus sp.]
MRIAVLCEYFHPDNSGGTPTDLSELTLSLKKQYPEIEIDVITSTNLYRPGAISEKLARQEDWNGVCIRRLNTPRSNRASMALRLLAGGLFAGAALLRLLRRDRYDLLLIVTNPPANALAAWMYAKLKGGRYVYLVHDLYPDIAVALGGIAQQSFLVRVFSRMQKCWLNGAHRVVVLGRCMKEHIEQRYGVRPDRIEVIPSWADPDAITDAGQDNGFRRANRLSGFVVLYAGNFSHYVNFDQILGAAKQLAPQARITFVFVGDGARRQELLAKVASESLTNVYILPKVPKTAMGEVLAASDVSLISLAPSMLGLGVPSKLYSTLAAGRPVLAIVPSRCEVARVLMEEQCGFNVEDGDCAGLADRLRELQGNPALAAGMGRAARHALEKRFTIQHATQRFYEVFKSVAKE